MKKNIIYIIIVLLSIIVVAGVSYIIIDSRSENKEGKTNKEENKTIENNISLSNEELEKYLSYVPDRDKIEVLFEEANADILILDSIDKKYLLGRALSEASNNDLFRLVESDTLQYDGEEGYLYIEKEKINPYLKEMYNLSINDFNLKDDYEKYVADFEGLCYYYFLDGFSEVQCGGSFDYTHILDSYKVENNNLVITEYHATGIKVKHTFKKSDNGYYWYSSENLGENDRIKLTSISEESNKIIEEFRIKLNGKSKTINVEFTKENYEDMDAYIIGGHLGDKPVLFTDFILNEEGNIFTKEKINELFNENNFRIIKGADNKDYLLVVSNRVNDDKLYIFNDNLELLNNESVDDYNPYCDNDCGGFMITTYSNTPCVFENNENPWYENYFNITESMLGEGDINYSLKIENNKIYYLAAVIEDYTNAKLEERVYTINNNQLTYEVINTYNATQVCQQT